MGLYAFFRLVWRPAFAFLLPMSAVALAMLFLTGLNEDLERARILDLSMLAVPLMLGMLVGQTVHDVRYRFFSWTLPNLQSRLSAIVIGIALLSALAWTWGYRGLDGEMNAMAGFAGFLLVFMAFAAVQRAVTAAWVALLAGVIWADPFFGFIRAQPIGWMVIALLGAAVCFYAGFSRRSSRRLLLSTHLLMGVNLFNRIEVAQAAEERLKRTPRPRQWRLSFVGTEIRDWVRAVEYGSFGAMSRAETTLRILAWFAFMGLCIISPAFMNGRPFDSGLEHAFHVLFSPPVPLEDPTFVPVALFLAIWAWSTAFSTPGLLQRGWLYPYSRRSRSLIVYRVSLRQNLRLVLMLSLTFVVFGALIIVLRGGALELGSVPPFLRGVIAVAILIPIVQWIRIWVDGISPEGETKQRLMVFLWLGMIPFVGLVHLLTYLWPKLFTEVALPIQAVLLIALALASQGLYYRIVTNHYQHADLI